MKVFKFGGASVKDAAAVKNVADIIKRYPTDKLVVVISAMGKTTNALEEVAKAFFYKNANVKEKLQVVIDYHNGILNGLFNDKNHPVFEDVNGLISALDWAIEDEPIKDFDFEYDQIVSVGELLSTKIVSHYLNSVGITCKWVDARDIIQTDNTYRDARVDWPLTETIANDTIGNLLDTNNVVLTQGFIGCTSENFTTTLGREGSDYTAAILAYCLNAESVTIWKDVPGVLNADPKFFPDAQKFEKLSYYDSIELTYYGATVIHPKTIKPLENKKIPLYVKSFIAPEKEGTTISEETMQPHLSSYIFKVNQVLISILPKDFSFIAEEGLSEIFRIFSTFNIKINLMQNSAISFSVCIDDTTRLEDLMGELKKSYKVLHNKGLQLITVRNYTKEGFDKVLTGKKTLLEQRTRNTAQFVVQPENVWT
jgi:aspartate kinase